MPGFTYFASGKFTKHRQRIPKFREIGNLKYMYKDELDIACFAHDAKHSDNKDLVKRIISDKVLKDRAHEIAINPKYDGYKRRLASMVHKFFDKKPGSGASVNEEPVQELHKPVIEQFKRRKVYARFKDNIWNADVAEIKSLSSANCGVKYLLCVMRVFTEYSWTKTLKDNKAKTVLRDFIEIVNNLNLNLNQINNHMQKVLVIMLFLMYLTHNEGTSIVPERFIRILKGKF